MSVTPSKIRLGAPSQFLVGSQDMGATTGGVTIKYNRSQTVIECDQFLAPVAVFGNKEEASFDAGFYETHMVKLSYILGLNGQGNITTTPGTPNTDVFAVGGQVSVTTTTADLTIPKNDGTANTLLVHAYKVHGYKELSLDFKRDKPTEYKGTFNLLADTTKAAGTQLFTITEQY